MNKFHIIILTTLFIIVGGILLSTNSQNTSAPSSNSDSWLPSSNHIYFWSKTCPHCTKVQEFIDSWDKKDSFQVEKIEVNESKENTKKFLQAGPLCNIPRGQLGVPLLITPEEKCLSGDEPIIEYLKNLEL